MYLRKDRSKNGRTYLSIGENFRVGSKTRTRHLESMGYVDRLVSDACPDPVAFWEAEVARRNAEAASGSAKVIVKLVDLEEDRQAGRVPSTADAAPGSEKHADTARLTWNGSRCPTDSALGRNEPMPLHQGSPSLPTCKVCQDFGHALPALLAIPYAAARFAAAPASAASFGAVLA